MGEFSCFRTVSNPNMIKENTLFMWFVTYVTKNDPVRAISIQEQIEIILDRFEIARDRLGALLSTRSD